MHTPPLARIPALPLLAALSLALLGGCDGAPMDEIVSRLAGRRSTTPATMPGGDSTALARRDSIARARQDSVNRAQPGYIVDSILPVEEELRRFRADLGSAPRKLVGGSESREALVRRFLGAVAIGDTAALHAMELTRAEFAYLVYPESPFTRPPYRSAPGLVWSQIENGSASGLHRLVRRVGGRPMTVQRLECHDAPERQGENLLWTGCAVRIEDAAGRSMRGRMFGTILERHGRFKFVSYRNDL